MTDPSTRYDHRTILVAIDFSEFSERALLWAVTAAERLEAPLALNRSGLTGKMLR